MAEPGRIEALLDAAGFDEPLVEPLDFAMRLESFDAYFEHQQALSARLRETLERLTPAEHAKVRDAIDSRLEEFVLPDGSLELPARTWVASALG